MVPATDAELIERFRNGDERGFNEIVTRYRERVYWVARRMVGSHAEADDVVQDVFVRAYGHLAEFRAESSLYTWLYRITVNLSLNAIRKKKLRDFIPVDEMLDSFDAGERTDDPLLKQEYQTLLEQAIASLPQKQKQVFLLKFYEEVPFDEMAAMLKKSVGGLKANYFHAVKKIQKFMRREMER